MADEPTIYVERESEEVDPFELFILALGRQPGANMILASASDLSALDQEEAKNGLVVIAIGDEAEKSLREQTQQPEGRFGAVGFFNGRNLQGHCLTVTLDCLKNHLSNVQLAIKYLENQESKK